MIKDALEWCKEFFTEQSALAPVTVNFPNVKRTSHYWDPDSRLLVNMDDSPLDERHVLGSEQSLIDYIRNTNEGGSVWVGESKITVDLGIDRLLTMPFNKTPLWLLLEKLVKQPSLPQAEAIKLLRQEFADFDTSQKALACCRSLRIATDTESIQESQAAKFGKSIVASTVGGDSMPDKLKIGVPVYRHSESTTNIDVFLSVDFNKAGCIRFEPNEAQMLKALDLEVFEVFDRLTMKLVDSKVNVYQGDHKVV